MKVRPSHGADLLRGLLYGLLLNVALAALVWLAPGTGLIWALALVWAMAALALTGISIMEERYAIAGGFWLLQIGLFALGLAGYLQVLIQLCRGGGCN